MPAPRKFLVASTSLPLALGWGWNLSLYVGMLLGLLILMMLLLWMLLKQLSNSVAKSMMQPVRSFRKPGIERRFQHAHRGSVRPFTNFNAQSDADFLRRAMKGVGTDEDAILMLLTARSNDQRQQIKAAFKKTCGKDLVSDLKSELGGLFEDLVVALMTPPISYDASQLHKAIKGAGTNDDVLIEILASRTGAQIKEIIKVYKKEFGGKLEKDVCGDTSGHYQRLLVILLQGNRQEEVDESKIETDATDLYAAGEGMFGTDEDKFITILGNRSPEHLRKVFDVYKKLCGSDIEESIRGETTGNLENLLLAVVKCVRSVPEYFAEVLYKSMRRAGTDDDALMRIMVSRSEVDMLDIRASFKKLHGASLYSTIQEDTSGDYQRALLYLCGGND
ncbi:annexin A5a [Pleuronectes platessa]|uniref:annexin A5a n=1 Tax=Pleuronectes platessa TaxID=8262 RepID=UPI00232A135A|nr:annexin A5a [Pleuronectes platessa]